MDEIKISLDLDIKDAIKGVEKFNAQATSSLKGLGSTIAFVKTAAVALAGAFAFGKIVQEATNADESIGKLAVSLKLSGDYSKEAMKDLEDYSGQLQQTTGFTGGLAQESLSLAKNFGLTNEASKELVSTAADLAKVTGGTLDQATRQLIDTYSGQGKALAKLFPEIRNYSEAQLKSGAAVDIVRSRIGGTAEAMNNTFRGAITGVANSFNDLLTVAGQFITQNPVIVRVVQEVSKALQNVTAFLSSNKKGISAFITTLVVGFVEAIPAMISGLQALIGSLGVLVKVLAMATLGAAQFIKFWVNLPFIRDFVQVMIAGIAAIASAFLKLTELIIDIPGVGKTLKLAGFDVEAAKQSLSELSESALNIVTQDQVSTITNGLEEISIAAAGSLDKVDEAVASIGSGLGNAKEAAKSFSAELKKIPNDIKSVADTVKGPMRGITEEAELMRRAFEDLTKAMFSAGTQNPFNALMAALGKGELARKIADFEGKFGSLQNKFGMLTQSAIVGVGNAAIQGVEGAKGLISGGAGAIADAYLPGTGDFAKNLVGTILQGPERKAELEAAKKQLAETEALIKSLEDTALSRPLSMAEQKQLEDSKSRKTELEQLAKTIEDANKKTLTYQVREFAKALPELIKMIPVVLKEFIKELPSIVADLIPELVEAWIESIPEIIEAWVMAGPKLIEGLFRGVGNLIGKIFGDGASKFLDDLGKAIMQIPEKIVQAIGQALNGLTGGLLKGGGDTLKTVGNFLLTGGLSVVGGAIGGDVGKVISNPIGAIGSALGLAKGGIVPEGFPNDTYPAMLTSGETVLPPPVSARFHEFMEKTDDRSSSNTDISALMSMMQSILSAERSISISIDGRDFAEVMYSLNKKGYRTS